MLRLGSSPCKNQRKQNSDRPPCRSYAGMVKLVNTLVLGTSAFACGFESHYPYHEQNGNSFPVDCRFSNSFSNFFTFSKTYTVLKGGTTQRQRVYQLTAKIFSITIPSISCSNR